MLPPIPAAWKSLLNDAVASDSYRALDAMLDAESQAGKSILPPREEIFNALELTSPESVKVMLLGQDPYPTPGDAHGLCFSVRPGVRIPGSLRNVYKELHADVGFRIPNHGCLEQWARQGILMLNTVLTLRANEAFSHRGQGWEPFTDAIIRAVNAKPARVVFVLWGPGGAAEARAHHRAAASHCGVRASLAALGAAVSGVPVFFEDQCGVGGGRVAPIDGQIADRSGQMQLGAES